MTPSRFPDIASPLKPTKIAHQISSISSTELVQKYELDFGVNVSSYFLNMPEIPIYECTETKFRFFYPPSIAGKDSLYIQLGKFPWFYKKDKWEHQIAIAHLSMGQTILDIGCGTGNFLFHAKCEKNTVGTGIELNPEMASVVESKGIEVANDFIENHAVTRTNYYDAVCSFQVLEHIALPGVFVENCLRALKPGGLLIIGVPNNDSFLRFANAPLNCPPHHMGLWTRESLSALTKIFPIDVISFELEPLSEIDWYQSVMELRYLPKRWMRSLFHRLGGGVIFKKYLVENAHTISGHTILAIYRKRFNGSEI